MSRENFLGKMMQMALPVLNAASNSELRKKMIVEQKPNAGRESVTGLEAVGRLLCGISPWFEAEICDMTERNLRDDLLSKACLAINGQTDPDSCDFINHGLVKHPQILVDTAFLSQAILRAPVLLERLSQAEQNNLINLLEAARNITPFNNNWRLFSTEVEILYRKLTGRCNKDIVTEHFGIVDSWYFGDGWYGDGPEFKYDYYNSLVINPMLLDLCEFASDLLPEGAGEKILERAQRHAEKLENMVAPDGTYIATGRSLTYRCGVYHLLAQLAWQKRLPSTISPSVAREVLFAVTEKTLGPASYRADGFLNIGISSYQPEYGESYISTGSLYLAAAAFLPLGLSANDDFWSLPAEQWTQRVVWGMA